MNDSRIAQARALVDDARCLLADMEEEGLPYPVAIDVRMARENLNDSLRNLERV